VAEDSASANADVPSRKEKRVDDAAATHITARRDLARPRFHPAEAPSSPPQAICTPTASGAVRLGRRSGALGGGRHAVGANAFAGNVKAFKTRATLGRKASAAVPLRVVAEKVVGIDLGTTNSAVRLERAFPSARRRTGVRMDFHPRHRE
jgi:hypothetical protein